MTLTAKQRRKLPPSAFAIPSQRKYPIPTKAQARAAGIGEAQRLRLGRNALARSTNKRTAGTYPRIAKLTRSRMPGIATTSRATGTVTAPGKRRR